MLVENCNLGSIGPASVSLRLKEIYLLEKQKINLPAKTPKTRAISLEKPYVLKAGEYVLGKTMEKVNMPERLAGLLLKKGKAFRVGLDIHCSLVDPGYSGEIIFGIHNMGKNEVVLKKGMSLNQLMVLDLKGKPTPLVTRFIGGKVF